MTAKLFSTLAASALLLSACANQNAPQTVVQAEPMDGVASVCNTTPSPLPRAAAAEVQMQLRNDGGWCAVRIADKDGTPFSYPLMRQRPAHGHVTVNKVAGNSRIEYTPASGFSGTDAFTVALVPKDASGGAGSDVLVQVRATVEADPNRPAVAAPAPAAPERATRSSTRRSGSSSSSSRSGSSRR